jgi:hypothetical protein
MPLRKLMKIAGDTVQKIKPVFLMSPVSVAQFLPPGSVDFDLLVIDEASQLRPEDALGLIARCRRIVVVGSTRRERKAPATCRRHCFRCACKKRLANKRRSARRVIRPTNLPHASFLSISTYRRSTGKSLPDCPLRDPFIATRSSAGLAIFLASNA